MKFLITGGSGFIGTNLVQRLVSQNHEVRNIDIAFPQNPAHQPFHVAGDIRNQEVLLECISSFSPQYVVHLAARTDLDGASVLDYSSNTEGVNVLCNVVAQVGSIECVVFVSSMLVCRVGHIPESGDEYSPTTFYGESKVIAEKIVKGMHQELPNYVILRPTSIWGPWFGEPYRQFFEYVRSNKFFRIRGVGGAKTFGYVENAVSQILRSMEGDMPKGFIGYLGDSEPLCANEWALEISSLCGSSRPYQLPYIAVSAAACFGDFLGKMGVKFPMTRFRLNNMRTANVINGDWLVPFGRYENVRRSEGILRTIEWLDDLDLQSKNAISRSS